MDTESEIHKLSEELQLWKQIKNYPNSLVSHMIIKYKQGVPLWIDIQKISLQELQELDIDEDIQNIIDSRKNTRFKDDDW